MPYDLRKWPHSVYPREVRDIPDAHAAIDAALHAANWRRVSSPFSLPIDTACGTFGLSLLWGVRLRLSDKADTKHQWNMLMLVNALKAEGITVDSSIEADEANSSAIWVSVGVQR